jgi:predicted metal-dependent hydrolase
MIQETIKDFIWYLSRNAAMRKMKNGKFLLQQEKRMQKKVHTILQKQMNWLLKELKNLPAFNSIQKNTIEDDIEKILSRMIGKEELVETIVFYSSVTLKKGGETSVKDLALRKFGISFTLKHPEAVKYLKKKAELQLSNYRGNITATTNKRVKEIIVDMVEKGRSYTDVAKEITLQGKAGVFSPARAEMIAVHEAREAYEAGRSYPIEDFLKENPDRTVEKAWNTVGDDRVTEECAANEDEGWIDFRGSFSSGDDKPPRSDNPRCRCVTDHQIP